ncbi:MAG: hypothetical protein ACYS0I_04625 [Planctomycetota bacterium]|jgi:hypothetical protein
MCKLKKYLKLKKEGKTPNEAYLIVRDEDVDFEKYIKLKKEGKTPIEVYAIAQAEGLNTLSRYKILCKVYHISFGEAKEVMVKYHYDCNSLDEYQEKHILPMLKEFFEEESNDIDNREGG